MRVCVEHVVIGEGLVRAQLNLWLPWRDVGTHATHIDQFTRDLWTDSGGEKREEVRLIGLTVFIVVTVGGQSEWPIELICWVYYSMASSYSVGSGYVLYGLE